MKNSHFFLLTLYFATIHLLGCNESYDPDLEVPDLSGHGYSLTPLGCMISGPWEVDETIGRSNVSIYSKGKQISSYGQDYTEEEKDLVFEFLKNGKMNFWFKKDYIQPVADSNQNDRDIKRTEQNQPKDLQIKKIYGTGIWQAVFKDSAISINFGDTIVAPVKFEGKYSELGSSNMAIQRFFSFDTTINGNNETCQKIVTTRYSHPWFHQF